MVRTSCSDKSGLKKGTWTSEEDSKLIAYVTRYGHWNWRLLPKFAGLARCGKSCRLRWLNYLRPNIKRGNYTQEEAETIIKLRQLGKRWSAIAAQLPGRTDNEIKNYWYTNLKKRFQPNLVSHEKAQVSKSKDHSPAEPLPNNIIGPLESFSATPQSTDSCPSATLPSSCEISITTDHTTAASNKSLVPEDEFAFLDASEESGSFLLDHSPVEPMPNNVIHPFQSLPTTSQSTESYPFSISSLLNEFSVTTYHTASAANENLVSEDEYAFMDSYKEPMIESFRLDHSELNQCQTM